MPTGNNVACVVMQCVAIAPRLRYNTTDMTQVTRKDDQEGLESLLRRFNRKVQQAGVITSARRKQYYEKPPSKTERRQAAITRKQRKQEKLRKTYLGR